MQTIPLYRYTRPDGGVNVSPKKPDGDYTEMVRVAADEGKILVIDGAQTYCADVTSVEGIAEIDDPGEEEEMLSADVDAALDLLEGGDE